MRDVARCVASQLWGDCVGRLLRQATPESCDAAVKWQARIEYERVRRCVITKSEAGDGAWHTQSWHPSAPNVTFRAIAVG
jgi:hypothetical protein